MHLYLWLQISTVGILAALIVISLVSILYLKLTTGKCNSNICLIGKTAIITGGDSEVPEIRDIISSMKTNSSRVDYITSSMLKYCSPFLDKDITHLGIGYETALDFAKRGAKVILASFVDEKLGKEAVEKIIKETENPNIFFKYINLASFRSVRKFAEEINKSEERLDILVNNAGAWSLPFKTTEDGLLLLMQTNYFGPFLLTILLLDLLIRTPNSRIVNIASVLAKLTLFSDLDINNLNRVPQNGIMMEATLYARSKNPRNGAQTTIYCSITKGIENLSGRHFHDCHVVKSYKTVQHPELPENLWRMTEKLLKLNIN